MLNQGVVPTMMSPEILKDALTRIPKKPFVSPLQQFIAKFCSKCDFQEVMCHLQDQNGMKRMELCIRLYSAAPPDVNQILKDAQAALFQTETTAEATLEEAEK